MNSEKYIGLDVHQATTSVALLDHTVETVASRAKRGYLSAAAGATASDPEAGKAGRVSDAWHTRDL